MRNNQDFSGQALYRSLSQGANPYRDRKKREELQPGVQPTVPQPQPQPQQLETPPYTPDPGGMSGIMSQRASEGLARGIQPAPAPTQAAMNGALGGLAAQGQTVRGGNEQDTFNQQVPSTIGDPYAYLAGAARRGGSSGGSILGSGAQGAMTGASLGSILPGIGTGIGAAVGGAAGALKGALTGGAASRPTDFSTPDATKALQGAYQSYLGREGSPDEFQSHLTNQGLKPGGQWVGEQGLASVLANIQNSPEALAYAQRGSTQPTLDATVPGDALTPLPKNVTPSTPGSYRGQLEGFASDKLDNADHNSPKYVFARLAQNYNVKDPTQREQLLAALKADPSGYFKDASWSGTNKDKLVVGGQLDPKFGGYNTFDVIRNAAGGGDAWQWGVVGADEPATAGGSMSPISSSSTLSGVFPAALSDGLQNKVDLTDPQYAQKLIQYLMSQLALGGALK